MVENVIRHHQASPPNAFTQAQLGWEPWPEPKPEDELTEADYTALVDRARAASPYFRLLVRDPVVLGARTRADNDIFYNEDAGLPRPERELAAAAASRTNGCLFCASVHSRFAAKLSGRAEDVQRLLDEGVDAPQDERWTAVVRGAAALTATPSEFGEVHVDELRQSGFDDQARPDGSRDGAFSEHGLPCSENVRNPLPAESAGLLNGGAVVSTGDVPTTADVGRRAVGLVCDRLPGTWKATPVVASPHAAQPGAVLEVEAPDGRATRLVFEVRQVVDRRDVPRLAAQANLTARRTNEVTVVAARYLSASVRDALDAQGLSYADATGNLRVVVDSPAMFVADRGQDRDPWRQGRPRGSLKGEPATRVARALLDDRRDWTVRELVAASGASTGAAYRVLDYLEREDLVVKEGTRYRVTDWERLLRAWSADASFTTTTRVMTFIEPRGLDAFLTKVAREQALPAVVTGSVAAAQWATYAPAKAVYVYVASAQEASESWGLRANTAAPNVVLLEPTTVGDVPFRNALTTRAGYRVAAPAQVAADLLNGPGREPAEGEHLIEWMKANEPEWRRGR